MLRVCARYYHSYTHLILAQGIVREPTVWVFITSKYPDIREIGLPNYTHDYKNARSQCMPVIPIVIPI